MGRDRVRRVPIAAQRQAAAADLRNDRGRVDRNRPPARREHRTVTLPDYQGVGIGNALSALLAGVWKGLGFRAVSTTTHPAMIQARCRSPHWKMHRRPGLARSREKRLRSLRHATTRLTAGFEYVGPAMPRRLALALLDR